MRPLSEIIKEVIPVYYLAFPELCPFRDGDRAGLLGQETAADFARRKVKKCNRGRPPSRRRGARVKDNGSATAAQKADTKLPQKMYSRSDEGAD